jgi:hypothetical protein
MRLPGSACVGGLAADAALVGYDTDLDSTA